MENATLAYALPPLPSYTLRPLPPLVPGIPDQYLTLALPILAYWITSMIFHVMDEWDLFPQYRLHTPVEVLKRNHATRWEVLRDVILQQIMQTVVGVLLALVEPPPTFGREEYDIAVWAQRLRLVQRVIPTLLAILGIDAIGLAKNFGSSHSMLAGAISGGIYPSLTRDTFIHGQPSTTVAFAPWELLVAKAIYYFIIPAAQFIIAVCIVDTWQYFLHRAMHMNKYLYTTFHSRHHRLYVPYAYGALYNHPLEGFLLDIIGTGMAYLISGMSVRQSMWFYTLTTIKTVDDHCGYAFPWDPLQRLTGNNAGYHDIHHQSWGIKTNFSQPFFTIWDEILGTKWVGGDVSARYERAKLAAQKKADMENRDVRATETDESKTVGAGPYEEDAAKATGTARSAHVAAAPRVPTGKATLQAISSRQQVLDDDRSGGEAVIVEETAEEVRTQHELPRRSPRKKTTNSGLKGLADRVGESLQGTSPVVLDCGKR